MAPSCCRPRRSSDSAAGRLGTDHTPAGVTIDGPMSLDDLRAVFPGY